MVVEISILCRCKCRNFAAYTSPIIWFLTNSASFQCDADNVLPVISLLFLIQWTNAECLLCVQQCARLAKWEVRSISWFSTMISILLWLERLYSIPFPRLGRVTYWLWLELKMYFSIKHNCLVHTSFCMDFLRSAQECASVYCTPISSNLKISWVILYVCSLMCLGDLSMFIHAGLPHSVVRHTSKAA